MMFLASPVSCCSPIREQAPIRGLEKPMRIEHHQPRLVPPPVPEPQERPWTRGQEWVGRTKSFASRASSRGSFSVRRKLNAYNGPRRPRIGPPTEFRHVEEGPVPRRVAGGFRPLELSIYMPQNQLSPILPHFSVADDQSFPLDNGSDLAYPPAALTQRSDSAMSFTIPRKPVRSSSRASSEWTAQFKSRPDSLSAQELLASLEHQLPKAPPPARLRSMTDPPAYERVKSALHEKFELEQRLKDIEEIIEERKSIYLNSRPTSRASRPVSIYSEANEPMPPPPPPPFKIPFSPLSEASARTSVVARAGEPLSDQRPKTAPSKTVLIPSRLKSFTEASAAFTTPSPSSTSSGPSFRPYRADRSENSLPPPPPLPLVLQAPTPPLRKKKSFSRVSNWLFPSSSTEHIRNISLDSVTNSPKPVTSREGFYQCVDFTPEARLSTSSVTSTASTLQSTLNEPAITSTWTPGSSPRSDIEKRDVVIRTFSMDSETNEKSIELTRVRTFGEKEMGVDETWRMEPMPGQVLVPGRNSVGVAF